MIVKIDVAPEVVTRLKNKARLADVSLEYLLKSLLLREADDIHGVKAGEGTLLSAEHRAQLLRSSGMLASRDMTVQVYRGEKADFSQPERRASERRTDIGQRFERRSHDRRSHDRRIGDRRVRDRRAARPEASPESSQFSSL